MQEYVWLCEMCRTIGVVFLRPNEELYRVIDTIIAVHHYLAEPCPHCFEHLKVVNTPDMVTLQDLYTHLPEWAVDGVAVAMKLK